MVAVTTIPNGDNDSRDVVEQYGSRLFSNAGWFA